MGLAAVYFVHYSRAGNLIASGTNLFLSEYTEMSVVGIGIGMDGTELHLALWNFVSFFLCPIR